MVTTATPSPASSDVALPEDAPSTKPESENESGESGFVNLLVKSIFEPGANSAVVLAMNVSFFLLILTLFGLAFLTSWNYHVLVMIFVSLGLWGSMVWFVMEISKVQNRSDNMPSVALDPIPDSTTAEESSTSDSSESRKDR